MSSRVTKRCGMKRYLLFQCNDYYPSGGWDDFVGDYDTIEDAQGLHPSRSRRRVRVAQVRVLDMKFPTEFLGRCQTCLDNAHLDSAPCKLGYANGQPISDDDCLIRSARKNYLASSSSPGN